MKQQYTSSPYLLVATPQILDSQFQNTVILLLEHDKDGALGFVLNNLSEMNLKEVVAFDQLEIPTEIPVWNAGPVDSSSGLVLHNQKNDTFEREISPGISLSASQDSLKKLILGLGKDLKINLDENRSQEKSIYPYRLLVGYAGWQPGQLEEEIQEGFWYQLPIDNSLLFNTHYNELWDKSIEKIGLSNSKSRINNETINNQWLH